MNKAIEQGNYSWAIQREMTWVLAHLKGFYQIHDSVVITDNQLFYSSLSEFKDSEDYNKLFEGTKEFIKTFENPITIIKNKKL